MIFGALLLAPGACSLLFASVGVSSLEYLFTSTPNYQDPYAETAAYAWLLGVALGGVGVYLLWRGARHGR